MEKGNIVLEIQKEDTFFQFCDDYCRKTTKEDMDQVLEKITDDAARYFSNQNTVN